MPDTFNVRGGVGYVFMSTVSCRARVSPSNSSSALAASRLVSAHSTVAVPESVLDVVESLGKWLARASAMSVGPSDSSVQ